MYQVQWTSGMNGQTAIAAALNDQGKPKTFNFILQYYGSGLGYLVDMINGTFDTAISTDASYFFGDFIVVGQSSNSGIDQTQINNRQTITFSYTLYDATTHSSTVLGEKHKAKIL